MRPSLVTGIVHPSINNFTASNVARKLVRLRLQINFPAQANHDPFVHGQHDLHNFRIIWMTGKYLSHILNHRSQRGLWETILACIDIYANMEVLVSSKDICVWYLRLDMLE
ncbi:hypothetical protein FOQG_02574 [Fusarium oxysporum f. sp. raphani 54005]|uniref:Uncharacterized protein n=2 Tax=Fusarium oxysporum TaxID=5507 RepID=X0D2J3_FUSOX|nr:hypothetical protein FOQG_02574 [Fusarium oxysporum f. sp. raphani 54005]EXL78607.1 hypothetical protein FOPG_07282 [Fusarium oxysporum f. sp. conglutinans race 2 54008]